MLEPLAAWLQLTVAQTALVIAAVFVAGMVRGFAGFGLSALTMASLVALLPPIALIPVCWVLESSASLMMARGGIRTGDRRLAVSLAMGSMAGLPLGLLATRTLDPDASRLIALLVILMLALLQFAKVSPARSASAWAPVLAGLLAGIATGLASIGGMVIALFLLSRALPVAVVRGSLVMFLAISMPVTGLLLWVNNMLDALAWQRGLALIPVVLIGVLAGSRLFDPTRQQAYRRVCLGLLIGLAALGLWRQLG